MKTEDIIRFLREYDSEELNIMEVCGTHTASISENAIESLISNKIHLISGPGCPVCVTVSSYVDRLCELALDKTNVIVTFGDMIRVPGSAHSLSDIKAQGADIRMVYTPLEMLNMAKAESDKTFIFACVGFETTTPVYALLLEKAISEEISNIKLLTALKTMPQIIRTVCEKSGRIDGFIAPGHVAAITGSDVFSRLAEECSRPFAVSGFKGEEILAAIYALVKLRGRREGVNLYKSVVKSGKNEKAHAIVNKYFEPCDAAWRGLGIVSGSGMRLKKEYELFDAGSSDLTQDYSYNKGCCCAEIITGEKRPSQCPLFNTVCTPESPMGACMVSGEGTCFNYLINNRG